MTALRRLFAALILGAAALAPVAAQETAAPEAAAPEAAAPETAAPEAVAPEAAAPVGGAPEADAPAEIDTTPAPAVEQTGEAAPATPATPPPAPATPPPAAASGAGDAPAATPPAAAPSADTPPAAAPARTITFVKTPTIDYGQWEIVARRAEALTLSGEATEAQLDAIRAEVVSWRERFVAAQGTNATRIATVRDQITALGPADAAEAPDIAERRTRLTGELTRLQAPGIAAEEAWRRADGLVAEIDRSLRALAADELLKLWPTPLNPQNWDDGLAALRDAAVTLYTETRAALRWPSNRVALVNNLPLILGLFGVALVLLWRGAAWTDRLFGRLGARTGPRLARVLGHLGGLGQVLLPLIGIILLGAAFGITGLFGRLGGDVIEGLVALGTTVVVARWLGRRVFSAEPRLAPIPLPPGTHATGQVMAVLCGVVLGLEVLRVVITTRLGSSEAAQAVLALPILVLGGLTLVRLGLLIARAAMEQKADGAQTAFRGRLFGLIGRGTALFGGLAALLVSVGYVSAAGALVTSTILSLALIALLLVTQEVIDDIYVAVTGNAEGAQAALIPTLVSFGLTLASIPAFTLIWGARWSDLTEIWTRAQEGFLLGQTRISPSNFLVFALIFFIGYMVTKLFQGSLKSTILPKTRLDLGAQNAIASGVGYLGIFLAALIGINAAGLDLSGLAIVAGALTVGIGFGLQNIVSNFVSGIILLIERPISEGDWVEVGTVSGIVKSISVRSTRIQTFDRSDVIVPNADFVSGRVTNWTRYNLAGRLIVPVTVMPGTDTRAVETILREIAEAQPMAILQPPPIIALMGFSAEAINFEIRVILRDVNFSLQVRTEINHQIAARFAAAGIDMSPQARDLRLRVAAETAHAREAGQELPQGPQAEPEPGPV